MLDCNNGAFEHLVSDFVAFTDSNRNANVVTDFNGGFFSLQAGLANNLQCVHFGTS